MEIIGVNSQEIRFSDGSILPRYCPHEGGDLSFGWIEGSIIRCPVHNLPICIKDGSQPCKSLRRNDETGV